MSDSDPSESGHKGPLTIERVQAVADSMYWTFAEGYMPRQDTEWWNKGLVAGWNAAMAAIGQEMGGEVTGKPYHERIKTADCPEGHESYEWTTEGEKKIGTATCVCGWTKSCKRHTARDHHEEHRTAMAYSAMRETEALSA